MSKLEDDLARAFEGSLPEVQEQKVVAHLESRRQRRVVRRRLEVGLLAIVVIASSIAMAVGLGFVFRAEPRPSPRPAHEATEFVLPGKPITGVAVDGSLWALTKDALLEVDIETGSVTRAIEVKRPGDVASAAGSIWVTTDAGHSVVRIDPTSGSVLATIPLADAPRSVLTTVIVGDDSAVWVSADETLMEIDPATNLVVSSMTLSRYTGDLALLDGQVWAAEGPFGVWRIDPASGRIDRFPIAIDEGLRVNIFSVAANAGHVVAVGEKVGIYHMSDGRLVLDYRPGGAFVQIDPISGALSTRPMVATTFVPSQEAVYLQGPNKTVASVDPATGEISRLVQFSEAHYAFAASTTTVWVTQGGNGVVHTLASVASPATWSGHQPPADNQPGLGPLGCPVGEQWGRVMQIPLTPSINGETSAAAVRRAFKGIRSGDVVTNYRTSEAGEDVKIVRGAAIVSRVFLARGEDWLVAEMTGCLGTGIRPPT